MTWLDLYSITLKKLQFGVVDIYFFVTFKYLNNDIELKLKIQTTIYIAQVL